MFAAEVRNSRLSLSGRRVRARSQGAVVSELQPRDRSAHRQLTGNPLPQANAYAMIHAYLKNGGTLEKAAEMANHASTRRPEEVTLDEVERILV
jgi:hypothetical protein